VALQDIDEKGGMRPVPDLDYRKDFDDKWDEFTPEEQQAMNDEIERKLNELVIAPNPKWGSIMNTSIEGGQVNPYNGIPGDWSDTPWHPIWVRCGYSEHQAALFFGNLWKLRIIERDEQWIGIRNDPVNRPTFPQKGITLMGKTYFLPRS
jgi:hypothetical protein